VSVQSGQYKNTAIKEIANQGIPINKLVIEKPVYANDIWGTGWVCVEDLAYWSLKAKADYNWYAGYALWQYSSDTNGTIIQTAASSLQNKCASTKDCV
jgi:hypothetical protein